MDLAFWGLKEQPYRIAMSPQTMTLLPGQQAAFRQINRAFLDGERVATLVGIHGVGKTVLAQHVVDASESRGASSAWAACVPVVGSQALYQMLLADLGQPFSLRSTVELRMQLVEHLLPAVSDNKTVLMVIDEAHHVPMPVLEELRPLVEIITANGQPGVQLLLIGTTQLAEQLHQSGTFGLRSWVGCRAELHRLDHDASLEFLQSQWKKAGGNVERQATDEAWSMLAEMGNGLPLEMSRLARHAFRLAQQLEQRVLDAEAVWDAAQELGLSCDPENEASIAVPMQARSVLKDSA